MLPATPEADPDAELSDSETHISPASLDTPARDTYDDYLQYLRPGAGPDNFNSFNDQAPFFLRHHPDTHEHHDLWSRLGNAGFCRQAKARLYGRRITAFLEDWMQRSDTPDKPWPQCLQHAHDHFSPQQKPRGIRLAHPIRSPRDRFQQLVRSVSHLHPPRLRNLIQLLQELALQKAQDPSMEKSGMFRRDARADVAAALRAQIQEELRLHLPNDKNTRVNELDLLHFEFLGLDTADAAATRALLAAYLLHLGPDAVLLEWCGNWLNRLRFWVYHRAPGSRLLLGAAYAPAGQPALDNPFATSSPGTPDSPAFRRRLDAALAAFRFPDLRRCLLAAWEWPGHPADRELWQRLPWNSTETPRSALPALDALPEPARSFLAHATLEWEVRRAAFYRRVPPSSALPSPADELSDLDPRTLRAALPAALPTSPTNPAALPTSPTNLANDSRRGGYWDEPMDDGNFGGNDNGHNNGHDDRSDGEDSGGDDNGKDRGRSYDDEHSGGKRSKGKGHNNRSGWSKAGKGGKPGKGGKR